MSRTEICRENGKLGGRPANATSSRQSAELPAFVQHHFLERNAADVFMVTDERNFSVLTGTGMLVGHHCTMRPSILRHCDNKRVGTVIPFVGLDGSWCVAMSCRTMRWTATVSTRKRVVCALAHLWQSSPGRISSSTALGAHSRSASISPSMRASRPGKIVGG